MPARYFAHQLPDTGQINLNVQQGLQSFRNWLQPSLKLEHMKPSVYTGAAGVAYALWHAHRHAPQLSAAVSEQELLRAAEQYARSALQGIQHQPPERYGWALLAGHAGVYCAAALVLGAAADLAARQGQQAQAQALRGEAAEALERYVGLQPLACSAACEEDEVLYGRSGYLLGALLLNRHVAQGSVPHSAVAAVARAIVTSGRGTARRLLDRAAFPTPLFYVWPPGPDASPYLGAAHGLMGILYALLHVPDLDAAVPGAAEDMAGALRYVLTLECDAEGRPGPHGHYPTQMGPWRDREPLVHWCHGATGAVFLFCKAHEQLGDPAYLEAARRAGEAVWQRGLLKKGPGACHGVSGSAYALLRLHRACAPGAERDRWLARAVEFARFMDSDEFRATARTPDHPHSLYEGGAAAVCLWADLLGDPGSAGGFPMFEVDI